MADPVAALLTLHRDVDAALGSLVERHRARLQCARGCSECCVDDIAVVEAEAELIRRRFPELLATAQPHPPGRCAFLAEDGACRIYPARPYVCRTEGLPLRWLGTDRDGQDVDRRAICHLNAAGPALAELAPEDCWTLGPVEARLEAVAGASTEPRPPRQPLRSLFLSSRAS